MGVGKDVVVGAEIEVGDVVVVVAGGGGVAVPSFSTSINPQPEARAIRRIRGMNIRAKIGL
jgi:hypothetical protein